MKHPKLYRKTNSIQIALFLSLHISRYRQSQGKSSLVHNVAVSGSKSQPAGDGELNTLNTHNATHRQRGAAVITRLRALI